ncbi:MAG: dockerin type I domain-containing protein [Dehalococcoidia bacterium]
MLRRFAFFVALLAFAGVGRSSVQVFAAPPQPAPSPAAAAKLVHGRPASPLNVGDAHIFPSRSRRQSLAQAAFAPSPTANMTYHNGPVMPASTTYAIFWLPAGAHFEPSGNSADDSRYENLVTRLFQDVGSSSLSQMMTQYAVPAFPLLNTSSFGGAYVDTTAYPHAGSTADPLMDTDIQAEVSRAIAARGWSAGPDKEFFVYTGLNIQSCADSGRSQCSYTEYCAYHSAFNLALTLSGTVTYTLYANMPDAWSSQPTGFAPECGAYTTTGQGPYSPNGDQGADGVVNVTSHEFFETITDPASYSLDGGNTWLGGWYDSDNSGEIGDKCAYMYGSLAPNSSDVTYNNHPYILQTEWSNAAFTAGNGSANSGCALSLAGSPTPTPTPSPSPLPLLLPSPSPVPGDANNDGHVTAVDALCVLRNVAGLTATSSCPAIPLTAASLGDVNHDGQVNAVDALCILRSVAGLTPTRTCPQL